MCLMLGLNWLRNMTNSSNCTHPSVYSVLVVADQFRPFENQDLIVCLYLRQSDQRARILCKSSRFNRRKLCCLPLSALRVKRSESCIQLGRPSQSGRSVQHWANLRFQTYERELSNGSPESTLTHIVVRHGPLLLYLSSIAVPGPWLSCTRHRRPRVAWRG